MGHGKAILVRIVRAVAGWLWLALGAALAEAQAADAAHLAADAGISRAASAPLEVTVRAESAAQRSEQSARSLRVIELDQQRHKPSDLGQVLARSEGVSVRRTGGLGSSARFALAGLSDEQIPVFLDGVPIEIAGYPFGLVNVPVGLLTRVEIHRGVVPVRLGADALGGAVDLISESERPGPNAVLSYQAGSFDTHRLSLIARYRHKPSGFVLRGSGFFDYARNDYPIRVELDDESGQPVPLTVHKRNDAYRGGAGTVETGFVNRAWARRLLLRLSYAALEKRIPHNQVMKTAYGKVRSARASHTASLRYESPIWRDSSVSALLAYSARRVGLRDSSLCRFDWLGRCTQSSLPGGEIEQRPYDQRIRQHSWFGRVAGSYAPSSFARLSLVSTLSFSQRNGADHALEQADDALRGRRELWSWISGLEHQLDGLDERIQNILSIKSYFQLARSDYLSQAQGLIALRQQHQRLGIADGFRVRLHEHVVAKLAYEWATRLPAPDQLFGDGVLTDANLRLRPESSHNLNLGLSFDRRHTQSGDFRASLFGFGRFSRDMIFLLVGPSRSRFDNLADVRTLGIEAATGFTSKQRYLQLDANVTWQEIRNTAKRGVYARYEGDPVPNRPYLFANVSAVSTLEKAFSDRDALSLGWYGNYVHSFELGWQSLGSTSSRLKVPARFVQTLEASFVLRSEARSISTTLQLYNLTDARIFDVFGVQLPGRTVLAKLTLEV